MAKNGLGTTYPNPLVGSVIVCDDTIIGEGWHQKAGEAHAEVNAINSVEDKSLLSKATIYVSLEPCSHFGKTPPCADLIIAHKIPNVVIGTIDPFAKVAGNGIKKLIEAGANVTVGILEEECHELNKRFFTFHNKKRPYVILKWAETKDGFIAPLHKNEKKPVWVSNTFSRQLSHKWRTEEQAILVGTNTVLEDNPSLTARYWSGKTPIRFVLDKKKILSKNHKVFNAEAETIVIKETSALDICRKLFELNISSVIIEGGSKTLQLFIDANIWDEARVFIGNKDFKDGIKSPVFSGKLISQYKIDDDVLKISINQ